jgi:hypothetical protein
LCYPRADASTERGNTVAGRGELTEEAWNAIALLGDAVASGAHRATRFS